MRRDWDEEGEGEEREEDRRAAAVISFLKKLKWNRSKR